MNTILDRFIAKIKSIAYGLYQRLTPKAKITFNAIIRTTVSFGLCCVAGLYMIYSVWNNTSADMQLLEVYKSVANTLSNTYGDERYDFSSYDFSNPVYLGNTVNDISDNVTSKKQEELLNSAKNYADNTYYHGTDDVGNIYQISEEGYDVSAVVIPSMVANRYSNLLKETGSTDYKDLITKWENGELTDQQTYDIEQVFYDIYKTTPYHHVDGVPDTMNTAYSFRSLLGDIAGIALKNAITGDDTATVTVGEANGFSIMSANIDEELHAKEREENVIGQTTDGRDIYKYEGAETGGTDNESRKTTELEENKDYYQLLEDYVTSEIFSGIGYATAHPIWALINALMKDFMETLRTEFWVPDPQKLSNINFKSGTLTFYSLYYNIFEISKIIGAIIAVFLFLFGILLGMFSKKLSNIKDTPLQLVARFTIAVLLLTQSGNAAVWFINIIKSLWDSLLNSDPFSTGGTFELTDLLLIGAPTGANVAEEWEINAKNGNFLSTFFDTAIMGNPALHNCAMLIGLIIMWPILKQFFALAVEIIERFLVLCLVYALFPIAVGMLCSSATTNVFKQYLQMLFAQLVILASNNLFVGGFCYLVAQGVPKSGIEGYVFTFGYLKAAQRFDSYLRTLGLSATQTGGNVLQGLGMAAHNVIHMVSAGNEARKGSGRLLTAAGGAVGSTALMTAGKVWGLNSRDVISAAADGQGGLFSKKRDLTSLALNGHKTSVKTNEVEQFMTDFCQNNTAANQTPIRAIDNKSMEKFMQEKGIDMKQVRNVNYGQMSNGTVVVNGIDSNNKNVSYSISSDLPDGKTPNKTLKNSEGYDAGYIYQSAGPKQTMDQSPDTYSEDMKTGKKKRKPYGS